MGITGGARGKLTIGYSPTGLGPGDTHYQVEIQGGTLADTADHMVAIVAQQGGGAINSWGFWGEADSGFIANNLFGHDGRAGTRHPENMEIPTAPVDILTDRIRIRESFTPTDTLDSSGNTGDVCFDDDHLYRKTAAGWKRAALSTF